MLRHDDADADALRRRFAADAYATLLLRYFAMRAIPTNVTGTPLRRCH